MGMGDVVEEKDDIDEELVCPHCKDERVSQFIIRDYTGMHNRETLIHCSGCEGLYIIHYKFDHIEKLQRE